MEEVESTLRKAPGVTDAGAYADREEGETRIVACVTAGEELDVPALRAHLRDRLPTTCCPPASSRCPACRSAPTASSTARPCATSWRAPGPDGGDFAPADATEAAVAALWRELLGAPPATADENFFDAGGHSLLAVRLAGRLEATAGRRVPLRRILGAPTVRGIAAVCHEVRKEARG
ncbi:hypothetical protein BLA24_03775 [Streptomyces cinnamoneus]|uniref:Carrier domain-containing protein n=1 Tax=Streptomyces cinnamoneus TaxID=53446 RepID=A0A2G1XPD8_STRCJ|nr:hypothetical protein BLA24_03775 [Streptomyces cinnamoneus]